MSKVAAALVIAVSAAAALPAAADRITLKGGGVHEGRVVFETERELRIEVLVSGKPMEMTIAKDLIESREATLSPLERYEARLEKTDRKDADALVALAVWCQEQKLATRAAQHLVEAAALAPDHPKAVPMLRAMGYVPDGKTWVPEADQKRAQGLERWGGQWLPKDQVAKLRAEQEARFAASREEAEKRQALEVATNALVRLDREIKQLSGRLKQVVADIETCEARIKEVEEARKEAEKRLAEAVRRRDSAQDRMRNSGFNRNSNNVDNSASRQYSEAKKDVREAEQVMQIVQAEAARAEQLRRLRQDEKAQIERQLAAKQAEADKHAAKKEALDPSPPPPPPPPAPAAKKKGASEPPAAKAGH